MALPNHSQTELDNQIGAVAVADGDTVLVLGCSSSGTPNVPRAFAANAQADASEDFGKGPGVQMLALLLAAGRAAVFCKVAETTAGSCGAVTQGGGGTLVATVAGANDTRHVKVRFPTGGTLGTAGIEFEYSLDGGRRWSAIQRLGTALLFLLPDTGTTITFGEAAQTITTTTTLEFRTFEPKWDTDDLAAAWAGVRASSVPWDFSQIVGAAAKADLDATKTDIATTSSTLGKKFGVFMEARRRDFENDETEAEWIDDLVDDFSTAESARIVVGAGEDALFSPLDRWSCQRPLTWDAVLRAALVDSARYELGRVKRDGNGGPLNGSLFDSNGDPTGHNEERTPGLDTTGVGGIARFMTARTHPTKGRFAYITRAPTMALQPTDFDSWQRRRSMDIACNTTRAILADEQMETPDIKPNGTVSEGYALALESACNTALRETMIKKGRCSQVGGADGSLPGAYVVVDRNEVSRTTKTIKVKTRVAPLGRVEYIDEEVAYENPNIVGA